MPTITVTCDPDFTTANKIRALFCRESKREGNPLMETDFNKLLDDIAQKAFNEGRKFEKEYPNLNAGF